jgi:Protein of unknown function (DUF3667)
VGVTSAPFSSQPTETDAPQIGAQSPACLNCGANLAGAYCGQCGQRDIPPYPSVRDLVIDAFWELSGWDGRFASTVRALVRRPGMLTREFLEGRRARYLSPLRLYLMASLVYFVLAASAPDVRIGGKSPVFIGVRQPPTGTPAKPGPERVANAMKGSLRPDDADPDPGKSVALTAEEKAAALKDIERAPALMRPFMRRAITDPTGIKRGLLETMPRMLFALLPIFALIVAAFYRGRKYPEHLYFAVHLHAFIFLALSMAAVFKFTRSPPVAAVATTIAMIWIPIYATFAFRRTYGGTIARTIAKEIGIGTIYVGATAVGFIVTVYWVSLFA